MKNKPNRTVDCHFRLTVEESEKIAALANQSGMSVSRYLRTVGLSGGVLPTSASSVTPDALKPITNEINRLGNNVNQIARQCNTVGMTQDLGTYLIEYMKKIYEQHSNILSIVRKGN